MPGTHLDDGVVGIVHVDHQEQIPRIAVGTRIVVLLDLDTVCLTTLARLDDVVVGKADVDILIALEAVLQVADVLLLRLPGELNHLIIHILSLFTAHLRTAAHLTSNDDRMNSHGDRYLGIDKKEEKVLFKRLCVRFMSGQDSFQELRA